MAGLSTVSGTAVDKLLDQLLGTETSTISTLPSNNTDTSPIVAETDDKQRKILIAAKRLIKKKKVAANKKIQVALAEQKALFKPNNAPLAKIPKKQPAQIMQTTTSNDQTPFGGYNASFAVKGSSEVKNPPSSEGHRVPYDPTKPQLYDYASGNRICVPHPASPCY